MSLKFSPLPSRSFFGFAQKYFFQFFSSFSSWTQPQKNNIRDEIPVRESRNKRRKKFLFSRAHKNLCVREIKNKFDLFSQFYSQANVEKCFFISRIAFFIFSLMRIFHLFLLCAVPYSHFWRVRKTHIHPFLNNICARCLAREHI